MLALYKRTKYVYIHIVTDTEMLWSSVNIFVRGVFLISLSKEVNENIDLLFGSAFNFARCDFFPLTY